ncbi:MAG: copper resistance protein B [Alphaproteobacteria bacterium]|nr:copper resistance protein B [Alphaproteobacteria bacterium]
MRIKTAFAASLLLLTFSPSVQAMEGHGAQVFHAFRLATDYGGGNVPAARWDLDGWIGGDDNKLWLKSEGGKTERAEFWALYSRNIDAFWDAQIGLRHDTQPDSASYLTLGFNGLAPYFFETEAHLFISNEGDVSARLRAENDFLVTQRLILQPYAEINLFAQDVPQQDVGSGLSDGEIGLQTRYEFTRELAPYVDVRYERTFGETASIAQSAGEDNDDFIAAIGLRLMF